MKRVIRRAIFGSIAFVGSKSRTSAAIRTSKSDASKPWMSRGPVTPATRCAKEVGRSLPVGMTQPRPVTTARRDGSVSGKKGYLRDRGGRADCSDPQASVAVVTLEDHCPVVAAEADVV